MVDITHLDMHKTPQVAQGPITRTQSPQLNERVSLFLSTLFHDFKSSSLPNNLLWLGMMKGTMRDLRTSLEVKKIRQDIQD